MTSPRITLIGPGAIGAALAAGLHEAGHQPTLVVRTPFDRLKAEWPKGELDVAVTCLSDLADLAPADVVIVATKATQNGAVADHVRAVTGPGSVLLIAQNGIDHMDRFAGIVGDDVTVVPAIPMLPAHREGPGHVVIGHPSRLVIPAGPAAATIESIFASSFVDIDVSDDWTTAAWYKLVINASSGGMGVLARKGSTIYADPEAQALLLSLMEEVAAVGRAEGANLADDLPTTLQGYMTTNAGGHTTSIVVDRLAGMPTEWRERNEIVVRCADKHGIDVPLSRAVATLMRLGEPEVEG
jgi:2-dehydropantoate 2-reductase